MRNPWRSQWRRRVVGAVVAVGGMLATASAGAAQTVLPPLDPVFVQSLRSLNSDVPTTVEFVNATPRAVSTFWIDHLGAEVFYWTLDVGASYVQQTYVTHPWLIRYADTQEPIVGFLPVATDGIATIEPYSSVVPEPSTLVLTGLGVGILLAGRRWRRRA